MKIQWSTKFRSQKKAPAKSTLCCEKFSQPQKVPYEIKASLRNRHFATKSFHSPKPPSAKIFAAAKNHLLAHECHFAAQYPYFAAAKWLLNPQSVKNPISQGVSQLQNTLLAHECHFTAQYPHFATAKWAAKMPLRCEIGPPLRKSK